MRTMIYRWIILLSCFLLLPACAQNTSVTDESPINLNQKTQCPSDSSSGKAVDFKTLKKGNGGTKNKNLVVFNSQSAWDTFSQSHNAHLKMTVDFSQFSVIGAFAGLRNTGGFSITISEIIDLDEVLFIRVSTKRPKSGSLVTMALTTPLHIVQVKAIGNKPIIIQMNSRCYVPAAA